MTLFYVLLLLASLLASLCLFAPLFKTDRRSAYGLTAIFTAGLLGLYSFVGSPDIIPLIAERNARLGALRESILANSQRVREDSKNLPAWVGLGQDFIETGQYGAAANAFRQAVILSGGDAKLILAYGKAQVMAADGTVTDGAQKAFEMVLMQDRQNPDARYFLALRKLQDGKTQEAMTAMKTLYRSLPADSPLKDAIDRQIGRK